MAINVRESGNMDDHIVHGDHLTQRAISFFYDNPTLMDAARDILRSIRCGFP